MQVVGVAAELGGQALQAGLGHFEADPVGRGHAQSFKTVGSSCMIWGA